MSAAPKLAPEPRKLVVQIDETAAAWDEYDKVSPGVYPAYCKFVKTYKNPMFKRWVCLIKFELFPKNSTALSGDDPVATVAMFLSLGSGEKPKAGKCSKYWENWTLANGGPPQRGDRLGNWVFLDRAATVEVENTGKQITPSDKNRLRDAESPYSVVRRVLSWDTGLNRKGFPPCRVERVTHSISHHLPEGSLGGLREKHPGSGYTRTRKGNLLRSCR
jgi:hypothetical protein